MAKLADIRREKRMAQLELAIKAGLSQRTILNIERGRTRPATETAWRICEALGVRQDEVDEFKGQVP